MGKDFKAWGPDWTGGKGKKRERRQEEGRGEREGTYRVHRHGDGPVRRAKDNLALVKAKDVLGGGVVDGHGNGALGRVREADLEGLNTCVCVCVGVRCVCVCATVV